MYRHKYDDFMSYISSRYNIATFVLRNNYDSIRILKQLILIDAVMVMYLLLLGS